MSWRARARAAARITLTDPRHLAAWLRSSFRDDFPMRARIPWLTFDAVDRLAALDLRGKRVFEWGSGGSTLFFLDRGAHVTSVEHDASWQARLAPLVGDAVDLRLIESEPGGGGDPADPDAYVSSEGPRYERYARAAEEVPDQSLNVALVDGRARPSCIKHAVPKLRHGGLLVVDDAARPHYLAKAGALLFGWAHERHRGAVPGLAQEGCTDVFVKP